MSTKVNGNYGNITATTIRPTEVQVLTVGDMSEGGSALSESTINFKG